MAPPMKPVPPATRIIRAPHGVLEYRLGPGGTCEIVDIEVAGEYRGKGIGRLMLKMLFDELKDEECVMVYAVTRSENGILKP